MAGDGRGPYVGPRPFERKDQALFFGRDHEAAALVSLVIAHPVVLLYAQSGAGKSSLLNAQVIPRLEQRGFEVLGPARVSGELPSGIAGANVLNIYVFNALMSLDRPADPATVEKMSLSQYLRAKPYPPGAKGVSPIRILIFDQFEELFTSFAGRWMDRASFFDDLGAALEEDPRVRAIFAIREEFIGSLDAYASRLPERLRTRFRLERLGADAAFQAATMPLTSTDRTFTPGAARKLIENLLKVPIKSATGIVDVSGEFVEPLHLQLVCTKLWESLPPEVKLIDEKYIGELGDVDEALAAYYEWCIAEIVRATGIDEGALRAWFEKTLTTPDGARGIVPRGAESTGGLRNDIVERVQNLYLIRVEMRGVHPWYELTHDRFVAPIRRSNEKWRQSTSAGSTNALDLEARAERWTRAGRPSKELLSGTELNRTTAWLALPGTQAFGVSDGVRDFVQASELARARRRRLGEVGTLVGVAVLTSGIAAALYRAKLHAEDATLTAYGDVAVTLAKQRGNEFDALAYGMRAVGPRLDTRGGPPATAVKGLQAAVDGLGSALWLRGYSGPVASVGISPDGKRVVALTGDEICAWDAITGRPLYECRPLPPQENAQPNTFFSPDRRWVYRTASPGTGGAARIWDARDGNSAFEQPLAGMQSVSFSRDGAWLAAWAPEADVKLLEVATGAVTTPFGQRVQADDSLVIAPGGQLAAFVRGTDVELWSLRRNERVAVLMEDRDRGYTYADAVFSPDAKRVAATTLDLSAKRAKIVLWSMVDDVTAKAAMPITLDLAPLTQFALAFSVDGNTVTILGTGAAELRDAATGALRDEVPLAQGSSAQLLDNGRLLIGRSEGERSTLTVLDPRTRGAVAQVEVPGEVTNADVANDFARLAAADKNNFVKVFEVGRPPSRHDDLSLRQLFAVACEKIRHQREFSSIEPAIRDKCAEDRRPG